MALITCEDCEREISSRAAACPHCGCPVADGVPDTGTPVVRGPDVADVVVTPVPIPVAIGTEVNVSVVMPEGLGSATASALRGAARSKAWGRLYETLRGFAIAWILLCWFGGLWIWKEGHDRLQDLAPGARSPEQDYGYVPLLVVFGLSPLIVLTGLRRWWRWLRE